MGRWTQCFHHTAFISKRGCKIVSIHHLANHKLQWSNLHASDEVKGIYYSWLSAPETTTLYIAQFEQRDFKKVGHWVFGPYSLQKSFFAPIRSRRREVRRLTHRILGGPNLSTPPSLRSIMTLRQQPAPMVTLQDATLAKLSKKVLDIRRVKYQTHAPTGQLINWQGFMSRQNKMLLGKKQQNWWTLPQFEL